MTSAVTALLSCEAKHLIKAKTAHAVIVTAVVVADSAAKTVRIFARTKSKAAPTTRRQSMLLRQTSAAPKLHAQHLP